MRAHIPVATYRLQLHAGFTFENAADVLPYLARLGVTDVYTSSYLTARPGSQHGYDIVDHNALNPEIGSAETHARFSDVLRGHHMGHILDIVPNHMGIAEGTNRWWNDVLENGPSSPYADYFDIDWQPVKRELWDKVLLPILGDQYGRVLDRQDLRVGYADGGFVAWYHRNHLPVEPRSVLQILRPPLDALTAALPPDSPALQEYQSIITALQNLPAYTERAPERVRERAREKEVIRRRLAALTETSEPIRAAIDETVRALNGKAGDPRSFDALDRLLGEQVYRLAHWQVAAEEINYRRFFDVNELAAIRMEDPGVFREAHRLVLALAAEGKITGLRVDHPDGLYDPPGYFLALQRERVLQARRAELERDPGRTAEETERALNETAERFQAACGPDPRGRGCRPLYVVAEKVLARGERLPTAWAIHGTTGYEFLNAVGGLFVDARHERRLTRIHGAFTGRTAPYADLVYEAKQLIMDVAMSSELNVLGRALNRLSERDRYSRDFTLNSLTDALKEIIACFPVYRTYIDGRTPEIGLQDRACIEVAVAFAKRRNPAKTVSVFDFVRDTLLLRYPEHTSDAARREQLAFVRKFQQVTAPVTAKGVEDTAFYRYHRLISLNEVGGDPDRFGVSVQEFHAQCRGRRETWPAGLSSTATHDTKRGEDVRARIHVLSEMPQEWRAAVWRWRRWNRAHRTRIDGQPAPDRSDEYLLYQTLVGAWPAEARSPLDQPDFAGRIQAYMRKAAREAKIHTSWISPNEAYEEALETFVARLLDPAPGNRFLDDFIAFQRPVARLGAVNSLAQSVLKITAPGIPDFYQGTELWDLSLVDPDNRRPVDFARRRDALDALVTRIEGQDLGALASALLEDWVDGRVKLYVLHRALDCRRADAELFRAGAYVSLPVLGAAADYICAFARELEGGSVLAIVPRLTWRLTGGGAQWPTGRLWEDTRIALPDGVPAGPYRDRFTGRTYESRVTESGPILMMADVLAEFPVALLERLTGRPAGRESPEALEAATAGPMPAHGPGSAP